MDLAAFVRAIEYLAQRQLEPSPVVVAGNLHPTFPRPMLGSVCFHVAGRPPSLFRHHVLVGHRRE
jgi:hypothetical protein